MEVSAPKCKDYLLSEIFQRSPSPDGLSSSFVFPQHFNYRARNTVWFSLQWVIWVSFSHYSLSSVKTRLAWLPWMFATVLLTAPASEDVLRARLCWVALALGWALAGHAVVPDWLLKWWIMPIEASPREALWSKVLGQTLWNCHFIGQIVQIGTISWVDSIWEKYSNGNGR